MYQQKENTASNLHEQTREEIPAVDQKTPGEDTKISSQLT